MSLSAADLDYLAKNTNLTKEQIESSANDFLAIAPDGKISRKDLTALVGNKDKLMNLLINAIDTNRDKQIELKEYMMLIAFTDADESKDGGKEKYTFLFRVFDLNNDGKITKGEFKRVFDIVSNTGIIPQDKTSKFEMEAFFKAVDKDNSGFINRDEFVQGFMDLMK